MRFLAGFIFKLSIQGANFGLQYSLQAQATPVIERPHGKQVRNETVDLKTKEKNNKHECLKLTLVCRLKCILCLVWMADMKVLNAILETVLARESRGNT